MKREFTYHMLRLVSAPFRIAAENSTIAPSSPRLLLLMSAWVIYGLKHPGICLTCYNTVIVWLWISTKLVSSVALTTTVPPPHSHM